MGVYADIENGNAASSTDTDDVSLEAESGPPES
jgi:hypothetical protein